MSKEKKSHKIWPLKVYSNLEEPHFLTRSNRSDQLSDLTCTCGVIFNVCLLNLPCFFPLVFCTSRKEVFEKGRLFKSFRNRNANLTEPAKLIWKLKESKEYYKISWSIISSASAYNISERFNICLTGKLHIFKADIVSNLNKRTELISKCCHENKYRSQITIDSLINQRLYTFKIR